MLGSADAVVGQIGRVVFFVDREVLVFLELPGEPIGFRVLANIVVSRAGDNQRRPRLVDQNVVHFIDDGEIQPPLRLLQGFVEAVVAARRRTHVVAQVIESKFVVRPVRDVACVGSLPVADAHVALDRADRQPQPNVERPHPLHVAARQVVVHRHNMDTQAGERVQVRRQGRHQRLAFPGYHFRDVAAIQHHAAHQLDVVMTHVEKPPSPFAA